MARKNALVIDDSSESRELTGAVLEEEGFTVFEASDGEEALDLLVDVKGRWLVLLDLQMPIMDGHAFMEQVRHRAELDVIVVTGSGVTDVPGARCVVAKPIAPEALRALVRKAG